jgi:propionyl-CoA synthetase
MSYQDVYNRSIQDPNGFWGDAAQDIVFTKKWDKILDDSRPPFYQWFTGAELNTCYNAIDIHVEQGRGDQLAIIYDSPVSDTKRTYTYAQLLEQVSKFAGVLKNQGVAKGDRVIIYMPMIPEAIIAMLACARLGAVHSVVFGGFAPNELATRIDDAKPKVIVSASCGIEGKKIIAYKPLLDDAIDKSTHQPDKCVIVQRPMVTAELKKNAISIGQLRSPLPNQLIAFLCKPLILFIFYTLLGQQVSRKASFVTMVDTPSPSNGQ